MLGSSWELSIYLDGEGELSGTIEYVYLDSASALIERVRTVRGEAPRAVFQVHGPSGTTDGERRAIEGSVAGAGLAVSPIYDL